MAVNGGHSLSHESHNVCFVFSYVIFKSFERFRGDSGGCGIR